MHELSRADARRVAVRAQLLTKERPTDLVETVRRLSLVQLDPTSAIAPSADLVLWSRLGSSYSPQDRIDAVNELSLVEFRGSLRAADEIALYRTEMAEWPRTSDEVREWQLDQAEWVEDNNACRLDILERLRGDGPLPQRELPDTCVRPWASSGWNNNRNVTMMLGMLVQRGEVAIAGRPGEGQAVGPRRADLPRRPGDPRGRDAQATSRGTAESARHRACTCARAPGRAAARGRGR